MDKLKPSNNQKEGKKGKTGEQKTGETGIKWRLRAIISYVSGIKTTVSRVTGCIKMQDLSADYKRCTLNIKTHRLKVNGWRKYTKKYINVCHAKISIGR